MALTREDNQATTVAVAFNDNNNNNNNEANAQRKQARKKRSKKRNYNKPVNNMSSDSSVGSGSDTSSMSDISGYSSSDTSCPMQRRKNYPKKKHTQKQVPELCQEEKNRFVALDCEMVGVGEAGIQSVVARVTLVGWDGQVLLDQYVKPDREVSDYRTFVSGITAAHLEQEDAVDIQRCRELVAQQLEDKVLVGHGLKNDMKALAIRHPWQQARDTAKYEPFMKVRFNDGILWPRKLKDLVSEKLDREIQQPGQSHCPVEDALATLDLYKKVRVKWEKAMDYKIKKTMEIEARQAGGQ